MIIKIKAKIDVLILAYKKIKRAKREQHEFELLMEKIEQALGFKLNEWQRFYIMTGSCNFPDERRIGKTTAYILRLLLDQSHPLLIYDPFINAHSDNPFQQDRPVPLRYVSWFREELLNVYKQLLDANVPVRTVIYKRNASKIGLL